MKKSTLKKVAPVLIIAGAIGLAVVLTSTKKPPEQKTEQRKDMLVEVKPVVQQDLTYQVWSQGSVQPRVMTTLTSEVNGVITYVADQFIEGGFFHKGDLLVQVEPYDYQTAVKLAEASLARATAALEEEKARGKVAEREWSMFSEGKAPELGLRRPQLAQELANVRSAEAELENARRNLIRTEIRAPYSGIVKSKAANIGQFISRGTQLGQIYGTQIAEVRLPLTDNDVAYLNIPAQGADQASLPDVELTAEVGGVQRSWNAKLVRTEGMLDEQNRVIYAVAQIQDPYQLQGQGGDVLRFGRFVKARIQGRAESNLVLLDRSLLLPDHKVLIAADNKLEIRAVTVQRMDERYAYISAGLADKDQLVLTAIANPLSGMALRTAADKDKAADDAKAETAVAAVAKQEAQ
ncbi:efflux RND transporter periplasmic adaptor subunit [Rheinheimera marina]|uniref:Efflux RND transporter periplasmic adaptor subunit n=1 Tax=Rheinheimera marina TaxID=1774958 RepID=A0ABV9JQ74_9GAMM